MKMLVWGTGDWADRFIETLKIQEDKIEGFVESKKSKEAYRGKKVYGAGEIRDVDFDAVIVASSHTDEISAEVERLGIEKDKVVFPSRNKIGVVRDADGGG